MLDAILGTIHFINCLFSDTAYTMSVQVDDRGVPILNEGATAFYMRAIGIAAYKRGSGSFVLPFEEGTTESIVFKCSKAVAQKAIVKGGIDGLTIQEIADLINNPIVEKAPNRKKAFGVKKSDGFAAMTLFFEALDFDFAGLQDLRGVKSAPKIEAALRDCFQLKDPTDYLDLVAECQSEGYLLANFASDLRSRLKAGGTVEPEATAKKAEFKLL